MRTPNQMIITELPCNSPSLGPQAVILSAPDPADYEGPLTRWVFPTDDNYFVEDIVERVKGVHEFDNKERCKPPSVRTRVLWGACKPLPSYETLVKVVYCVNSS